MVKNKFYYLYLIGGSIALILFLYQVFTRHSSTIDLWNLAGDIFLAVVLYYLAYKSYHEKKDHEMM